MTCSDKPEYPPIWYSRIADYLAGHRFLILVLIYFLFFFVWPFLQGQEPVDIEMLEAIGRLP